MAIKNPLTVQIETINQRIRNRQDIANVANEDLFGLLNNQTQKRFIIDNAFNQQLQNLNTNLNELNGRIAVIEPRRNTLRDTTIPNFEATIRAWNRDTETAIQTAIAADGDIGSLTNDPNGIKEITQELRDRDEEVIIDNVIEADATMKKNRDDRNKDIKDINTELGTGNTITRIQEILDNPTFKPRLDDIIKKKDKLDEDLINLNATIIKGGLTDPQLKASKEIQKNIIDALKNQEQRENTLRQEAKSIVDQEHKMLNDRKTDLQKNIKDQREREKTKVQSLKQQRERRLNELKADVQKLEENIRKTVRDNRQVDKEQIDQQLTEAKKELEELQTEMKSLETLRNNNQNLINLRQNELTDIRNWSTRFNLATQTLPNQNVNLRQNIPNPIVLDGQFFLAGQVPNFREYELCDTNTGETITHTDGTFQVTLVGGKTVTVSGVTITRNPTTQEQELRINNLKITPTEGLQFPVVLQLAVRGRTQESNTTTFLDHYKTIDITIDSGQLAGARMVAGVVQENDPTTGNPYPRVAAYNGLNQTNRIDQRIASEYSDTNRIAIENEVLKNILSAGGNEAEINAIYSSEERRDALIQRIRAIPGLMPIIDLPAIQQQFRYEMTRQDNTTIPAEALVNIDAYTDYLRLNFPEKIKSFAKKQIERTINTGPNRNVILRELLNFQTDQETNKVQNRITGYDNLNQNNTINNRIASEYAHNNRTAIENEVLWKILREGGREAEINEIYNNEDRRNIVIQRIRAIPGLIPVIDLATLQQQFRNEMIRPDNTTIPPEAYVSVNAFTDYLSNNLPEKASTFVRAQIETAINTGVNRDDLLRTMIDFQSEVRNDRRDNDDHMLLNAAIPNVRPQARPRRWRQRMFGIRSQRNTYMKFFEGREGAISGQTFETENGPIKYDVSISIPSAEKIVATIKIEGEDEPLIIEGRDNNELVNMILTRTATKSGEPLNRKLRCHLALNAMKVLIQKAPTTMHREYDSDIVALDGTTHHIDRIEARMRGKNLIVRGTEPVNQANRQRTNHLIFDEKRYKNLHNIADLERGMTELSSMLTDIMEANCEEYTNMTTGFWNSMRYMRYGTNFPLRGGRAKRLWGRIRHKEKDYNFDFTKSVTAGAKTVNIGFEKNKLTIAGTYKGNNYEYKGANLGDILNNKIKGMRVFDGVELAIIEGVNEAMIENMRKNTFVGPESFAVSDINTNKTGKVYFMDSAGDLSYLEIEDRGINPINGRNSARIPTAQLPPQRVRCNEKERKEFMQNPALGGRLVREMRLRFSLF